MEQTINSNLYLLLFKFIIILYNILYLNPEGAGDKQKLKKNQSLA